MGQYLESNWGRGVFLCLCVSAHMSVHACTCVLAYMHVCVPLG